MWPFYTGFTVVLFFRSDPPSQSVSIATQELLRLTEANPQGLPGLDPLKDLHLRDIELVEKFRALELMKEKFSTYNCTKCPRFTEHVSIIFLLNWPNVSMNLLLKLLTIVVFILLI